MQSAKKNIIKFFRQSLFQGFWESLHNKSLVGMNYWGGARFAESGELNIIKKLLADQENAVFFDVGANNGGFAAEVADILPGSAKIYCFEPLPSMYHKLVEATAKKSSVKTHNIGFGIKDEVLKLFYVKDNEGLTSLYENIPDRNFTGSESVQIRTLDAFLQENNISEISYLKIDVEGHELKVLEGAKKAIDEGRIKHIQFEFGESMIDSRVFFRDFWNLLNDNYRFYRILPNGIREVKQYSENLEIFHCVNFIAVLKKLV